MNFDIPADVMNILDRLNSNGLEAFLVGGCVRDALLKKEVSDWDICTVATPDKILEVFDDMRVVKTGLSHGTVALITNTKRMIEVTTYRKDGEYFDNRRPSQVEFVTTLKDDLSRRDFTINAMCYSDKTGIIDYFGGINDLKSKIIRCVGQADSRFCEDALRIMRALRFSSVYDFDIEPQATKSIHKNKNLLKNISSQRVSSELLKLLCGNGVKRVLTEFADVLGVIIPQDKEMFKTSKNNCYLSSDVWLHTLDAIHNCPQDPVLRLVTLFNDMGSKTTRLQGTDVTGRFYGYYNESAKIAETVLHRLKFDNETCNTVTQLVAYHDATIEPTSKNVRRWLNRLGKDKLVKLIKVKKATLMAQNEKDIVEQLNSYDKILTIADDIIKANECFSLKDLALNGSDLLAHGVTSGKEVGKLLNKLLDLVLDEKVINDKQKLLEQVKN
ncbi:MAG: tRNA nucleotidyltransferase [Oscillospiraceae bacterium]